MALAEGTKVKHLSKSGPNLSLPSKFDAGALYYIQKSDENYELYFAISETEAKKVTTFITEDVSNLAYVKGDSIEAAIKKVNQSIKNAKVIINQKGEKKGEFTLNQNGDVTINLSDSDTIYNPATTSTDGLMSAADKTKLDSLLVNGLIDTKYLPSYVDDVEEYDKYSDFPEVGESGKIYVDLATNKTYRWGGSTYVVISETLAVGTTTGTAYDGAAGAALKTRVDNITNGTTVVPKATDATNATNATKATNATNATNDSSGNNIASTYFRKTNNGADIPQTVDNSTSFEGEVIFAASVIVGDDFVPNGNEAYDIGKSDCKFGTVYAANFEGTASYANRAGTADTATNATKAANATKAEALTSTSKGDKNTPVYFDSSGKPVACEGLDLNTTGTSQGVASSDGNSSFNYEDIDAIDDALTWGTW